ncbi:LPS-assembly protein LptD [Methyloceanibacter methanicus]|uniref:LPS-assembly protein LptD n=1 Tax=Methyloceanibacter methanicus TaxID=1774968 RepID=UPI001300D517|nr:LPS assembly protein LptD [Methyloceanibacter methanicus]
MTSHERAHAQAQTGLEQIVRAPDVKSSDPMLLQADELIYENNNARVTAKGNVEVYYGDYTLLADRIVYDRNANTLAAEGNVRMKDPDGAIITANELTLTDDFRDGFVDALKFVSQDDTRISAQSASREAGNVTVFQKGMFTPCKICRENPEKAPTWRIRAGKITHKRDQAKITFNDAVFDLFGVPVLWVPYFETADPTVKRKSGFLIPSYSHSDELGSTVQVPYYFALSDHYDFTFAPMWTEKAGTLLLGDWRQRTAAGGFNVELAGVFDNVNDDTSPAYGEDFRGSIKSKGRFALDPYYSWGWDVMLETDETFRRYYNLDSRLRTDRVSQVYLEGLRGRNYFSTRFYNTQSLLFTDEEFSEAVVYPIIDYDYIVDTPVIGGELSFNSNTMVFSSADGTDSNRFIMEARWRRQLTDGIGQVFTPFGRLRGDVYSLDNPGVLELGGTEDVTIANPNTLADNRDNGTIWRGNAVAGLEYRYPFVATTGRITHTIEPIGQIIARPSAIGDQQEIPNEDALSLVFDDTILFDIDKFSGYDRIETGTRANVGFGYTAQLMDGGYARAVFGQSYQIAGDNEFDTTFYQQSGLATSNSDYVTGLYVQTVSGFSFTGQARFDQESFDIVRTDLGSTLNYGPVQARVNYARVPGVVESSAITPNLTNVVNADADEEILFAGALAITDEWWLLGNLRYDLAGEQTITDGLGLRYKDDCFKIDVTYQRSFIRDQDIEPDERFVFTFALKHLGEYTAQTDIGAFTESGDEGLYQ